MLFLPRSTFASSTLRLRTTPILELAHCLQKVKSTYPSTYGRYTWLPSSRNTPFEFYSTSSKPFLLDRSLPLPPNDLEEVFESIETCKPKVPLLYSSTDLSWTQIRKNLNRRFLKSQLLAYLNATSDKYSSTLHKEYLLDELLQQWKQEVPSPTLPATDLKEIQVTVPCSERDLFFLHGFGQTLRQLMVQTNAQITLEKEKKRMILQGTNPQIKKTMKLVQTLLRYHHEQLSFLPTPVDSWDPIWTDRMVRLIMQQEQVYIEQKNEHLCITATTLASLFSSKQRLTQLLDHAKDHRWYALNCISKASLEEDKWAFLPFFHPNSSTDPLFRGLSTFKLQTVKGDASNLIMFSLTSSSEEHPTMILKQSTGFPSITTPPLSLDHYTTFETHRALVQKTLSHLPTLPNSYQVALDTRVGRTHFLLSASEEPFTMPWSSCRNPIEAAQWFQTHPAFPLFLPHSTLTEPHTFLLIFSSGKTLQNVPGLVHLVVEVTLKHENGLLEISKMYERIIPITIDSVDFTTSQTLRTDVHYTCPVSPSLSSFFHSCILPSLIHSSSHLFCPSTFVWNQEHYHLATCINKVQFHPHEADSLGWRKVMSTFQPVFRV